MILKRKESAPIGFEFLTLAPRPRGPRAPLRDEEPPGAMLPLS